MQLITKISFEKLASFMLATFIFVLLIDPANVIFKLKIPIFALAFGTIVLAYPKVNKLIYAPLIVYTVLTITSLTGYMYGYDKDFGFQTFFFIGFLMAFMIPWTPHMRLIEKCALPAIIIAIIVVSILAIFMALSPQITNIIYGVLNDQLKGTLMVGYRDFVRVKLFTTYYTSSPVLLLTFGYYMYQRIFSESKKTKLTILCMIIAIPLILGGTRAMVLSTFAIALFTIILKLWQTKRGKVIATITTILGVLAAGGILITLLADTEEESLATKTVLLEAFNQHIIQNPETLLFGNGVGATFNSLGARGYYAVQSEWTYLELIRWFGIPLSIVILLVYLYPIYILIRNRRQNKQAMTMIISYIFYLLLAGTNPYLFSSNGILALLIMYSYSLNPYYDKQIQHTADNRTV